MRHFDVLLENIGHFAVLLEQIGHCDVTLVKREKKKKSVFLSILMPVIQLKWKNCVLSTKKKDK